LCGISSIITARQPRAINPSQIPAVYASKYTNLETIAIRSDNLGSAIELNFAFTDILTNAASILETGISIKFALDKTATAKCKLLCDIT
jgi:hypothetical protein